MATYDWFEERLEVQSISDDILSKFVSAHVNIFYCFGGLVLTSFLLQVASGFALTMYYRPTVVEAYSLVESIIYDVHFCWLIRSVHPCIVLPSTKVVLKYQYLLRVPSIVVLRILIYNVWSPYICQLFLCGLAYLLIKKILYFVTLI